MSEETKPFEGNEPNPSATEAGIPSDPAKADEDELDAKVKENLGAHLDPVEEEKKEPEAYPLRYVEDSFDVRTKLGAMFSC